jgi:hypothetical protein
MPDTQDLVVVARNPGEMQVAQDQLIAWAAAKIEEKKAEHTDLEENYQIAKKNKWRTSTLKRASALALKRVEFYEKVHAALQEGFCIIPNMDLDVFAIRTTRKNPTKHKSNSQWSIRDQKSSRPALGEGRYVDSSPLEMESSYKEEDKDGKLVKKKMFWAEDFQEPGFPFTMAKPQILDATGKALALKVFDEVGVLPKRRAKGDPMVVGRIIYKAGGYDERSISFLITWFVDTKDFF